MVRVSKIGVWDVNGELIRDSKTAEKAARKAIIEEMVKDEDSAPPHMDETPQRAQWMAIWVSENWDIIENKVKAAMAGT
jgi:hypothetical protein